MTKLYAFKQNNKYYLERRKEGFDLSKFTVVGSPTITEDGIIECSNDLSKNNYITKSIRITPQRDFEINFGYEKKINANNTANFHYGLITFISDSSAKFCCYQKQDGRLVLRQVTSASQQTTTFMYETQSVISDGWQNVKIIYKEGFLKLYIDGSLAIDKEIDLNDISFGNLLQIRGNTVNNWLAYNSIDLTSISIIVDGKEVFTGAKEKFYAMQGGV